MATATVARYRERLWPSAFIWGLMVLMTFSLGVAVAHMYGPTLGTWLFVGLTVVATLAMLIFTPLIEVSDAGFRAGVALLPLEFVGVVRVLDAQETRRARSANAHPAAYFMLRAWIKDSVIVQVSDLDDPHPYWHVSSRNPQQLETALKSFQGDQSHGNATK